MDPMPRKKKLKKNQLYTLGTIKKPSGKIESKMPTYGFTVDIFKLPPTNDVGCKIAEMDLDRKAEYTQNRKKIRELLKEGGVITITICGQAGRKHIYTAEIGSIKFLITGKELRR